jgi:hypothetical protein
MYGQSLIPINIGRQYLNGRIISNAYQEGDVDGVMIGCGQSVGLIHEMEPHGQSPWYLHEIPAYARRR